MSQAPTSRTARPLRPSDRSRGAHPRPAGLETAVAQDLDNLVVRIAVAEDRRQLQKLAGRTAASLPTGGMLLAAVGERFLAAASLATRETVSDASPSGGAAAAVLRYRLAEHARRTGSPRRAGNHV
jgi:hypothetical protein